jgi:hypothetical protein
MNFDSMMADKFYRNQSAMNTGQDEKNYALSHPNPEQDMLKKIALSNAMGLTPAGTTKPMDVKFNDTHPDITPVQKETLDVSRDKEDSRNLLAAAKLNQGQQNINIKQNDSTIRQHRAEVYDWKAKHPDMKIVSPPGSGQTFAIDPKTGESREIQTSAFSNAEMATLQGSIKSSQIDQKGDIDKSLLDTRGEQNLKAIADRTKGQKEIQDIKGNQSLDQINRRGDIQGDLLDTRGKQSLEQIGARGDQTRKTNEGKPNKGLLPTQVKVQRANSAGELINTRPDLAPFIHIASDGTFTIDAPSEGMFGHSGPNADQYDEIKKSLYGDSLDKSPKKADPLGIR